ncbi:PQQ-dependent sugar dehydrogenase [Pseudidiomarina insulisalsae]|uniref:Glucose dehydrogenase n=1 Tax=Pseudidiomarina insulisalsae TaxID=575789 RepID=A0A432YDH1_9GAMM|nr:PQQ-dependent sugar dehydrogenase [Pseudidiomarina insulisalsae]RUO59029.1 glucose dehydrogenase [Pseudidiomarina insulisalsae]
MKGSLRLILCSLTFSLAAVANASDSIRAEVIASGLNKPWALQQLPEADAGWLVTEMGGRLLHLAADGSQTEIHLDLPSLLVSGQGGLFDISLAPDFAQSRTIYLSYACGGLSANTTCLARTRLSSTPPYSTSEITTVFTALPLRKGAAHYGGRLVWLPDDTLLLTLGDGFDYREQAQNLSNHIGKVVRLQSDGTAPADNPFPNKAGGVIYSYGHRNSQGLVYDAQRDALWQHEHGPRGGDEINRLEAGENYGWPITSYGIDYTYAKVTPYQQLPGVEAPLHQWTPSLAPSDMALYDGSLFSDWQGDLLVTHLAGKRLQVLSPADSGWQVKHNYYPDGEPGVRLRAVTVARDGSIWLVTDGPDARILRLTPAVQP